MVQPNMAHLETNEFLISKHDLEHIIKLINEMINRKQQETILWSMSGSLFVTNLANGSILAGKMYRDHQDNLQQEEVKISQCKDNTGDNISMLETNQESGKKKK